MTFQFTVSPDFTPAHLSGWYIFNTWLQKHTGLPIHLEMYNDFLSQRAAIESDRIDLIYANPFDAAMLVREKGFRPLVKAEGAADEAMIVVGADSPICDVADFTPGTRVTYTEDPDVRLMGLIMLEPGDLGCDNIVPVLADNYVLVAKNLLNGSADVGIFLAEAYDDLSAIIKSRLKVLVKSQISVIHHALMIGPNMQEHHGELQKLLLEMSAENKGDGVLQSLGFNAWQQVEDEDMEFMIDLMDALNT